ncbi:Calpain-B [Labeo rohita]|uniref:Calpain-B n=1 Tax=Labeo rohita TaxID=84645 RepID=A0ABQ8L4G6_LABRO|nr:Calpain-B [Labeo rohita]
METLRELSACPVMAMETIHELTVCSVTAKEVIHELIICPAVAMEAAQELSACSVTVKWSIHVSAPLWPPNLRWSFAPPWLHAPLDPTLQTSVPQFHCLPLPYGPGLCHDPGPVPLHGLGPPSLPLFRLCSTTLLVCFNSARDGPRLLSLIAACSRR